MPTTNPHLLNVHESLWESQDITEAFVNNKQNRLLKRPIFVKPHPLCGLRFVNLGQLRTASGFATQQKNEAKGC